MSGQQPETSANFVEVALLAATDGAYSAMWRVNTILVTLQSTYTRTYIDLRSVTGR
jgi:hypothetical protein